MAYIEPAATLAHTRPRPSSIDPDVLVVGAGPIGLLAACELLRRGVRVRLIDRSREPVQFPRAPTLWPRALDILEDLGIAEGIRNVSVQINTMRYFSDRRPLASFDLPADLAPRTLPQYQTERLLTERLHTLGGQIEWGVRLLRLEDLDPYGRVETTQSVTAVLEHQDGVEERVHASFMIGADGANSTVRGRLGIGFRGTTYEMAFALIDTRIKGYLPPDEILNYQAPTGTLVIVPQPEGVFRFLSIMPERQEISVPMMQAILDERGPQGIRITEPVWQTVFRVHARQATDFQRGPVFLAGDAAHVHSPAGGQGMNNGLQDAHNLGWKLAAVIHGQSPMSLLLSYGHERAEATRRIVRDTDLHTRVWTVTHPAQLLIRDATFRLLHHSGVGSRFYAPVMAGRRLAYSALRNTQQPFGWTMCHLRCKFPGGLKVGAVLPRRLMVSLGIISPGTGVAVWTVVLRTPPNRADWLTEATHITGGWPLVRAVVLPSGDAGDVVTNALCHRPGYYLIRPDGHIAAHGHERDLDRLDVELSTVLLRR